MYYTPTRICTHTQTCVHTHACIHACTHVCVVNFEVAHLSEWGGGIVRGAEQIRVPLTGGGRGRRAAGKVRGVAVSELSLGRRSRLQLGESA